jgi:hypothetical protein
LELKTVYFEHPGSETTDAVLNIALSRAQELGIKNIVVASTTGATAVRAVDILKGFKVIVVTHVAGMREPNVQEFTEKNRQLVEAAGGIPLTAAHAFSGLSGAMRLKFNTYVIGDIVASTLRIFGQGLKVACEISLMAADSGLVRTDEDVIAIGGTGHGADTALVLRPATSRNFFELRVKEILCKPHR